jgi:hypothetical protein
MNDTSPAKTLREELTEVQSEIKTLRDTLRVQAHLARLEAEGRLDEFEARLLAARELVRHRRDDARDEVVAKVHAGLAEVKKGVRQLRDALEAPRD